jgi:hypothetical protein
VSAVATVGAIAAAVRAASAAERRRVVERVMACLQRKSGVGARLVVLVVWVVSSESVVR